MQEAWIDLDVPQCGYCQSGQIMSGGGAAGRIRVRRDADIDAAMTGNICRCGTYQRIRAAITGRRDAGAPGGARVERAARGMPSRIANVSRRDFLQEASALGGAGARRSVYARRARRADEQR